jgi:hypothetical protein
MLCSEIDGSNGSGSSTSSGSNRCCRCLISSGGGGGGVDAVRGAGTAKGQLTLA